jgi:hypothetical protein
VLRRAGPILLIASGLIVLGAFLSLLMQWMWARGGVAYSPIVAIVCVAMALLGGRVARDRGGVRVASWILLAWVPCVCVGAFDRLSKPLLCAYSSCSSGEGSLPFLLIVSLPCLFCLMALIGLGLERVLSVPAGGATAWLSILGALVALASCLGRLHLVAPDDYVDSLPVVGELLSPGDPVYGAYRGPWFVIEERAPSSGTRLGRDVESIAARESMLLALTRDGPEVDFDDYDYPPAFDPSGCLLRLRVSEDLLLSPRRIADHCDGIRVRAGEPGVFIVEVPRRPPFVLTPRSGVHEADLRIEGIASSLRPPTAWIVSLAVGTVLALGLGLGAVRVRFRADAWRSAVGGTHRGKGWVLFDQDAPPVHFAAAASLPAGPVSVRMGPQPPSSYRVHGGGVDGNALIAAGTSADILERAELRSADLYALARLVSLVTLAPVVAGAALGLLG